jgi:hypothetical protein
MDAAEGEQFTPAQIHASRRLRMQREVCLVLRRRWPLAALRRRGRAGCSRTAPSSIADPQVSDSSRCGFGAEKSQR